MTPEQIAHRVSRALFCVTDVSDADPRLTAFFVSGAARHHVRGFALMSGSLCAAQVADWLCCDIPIEELSSLLPSVAAAIQGMVRAECVGAPAFQGN